MSLRPCRNGRQACRRCVPSTEQRTRRRPHIGRPTVHGITEQKQMTLQRSRARLINQLILPDEEGEFYKPSDVAKSQTSPRNYPTYSVTSHTSNIYNSRTERNAVVPTYPLQSLRWNPYVEMASIDDYKADYYEELSEKCSCENCTIRRLAEVSSAARPGFRDNIMQFTDRFTMTAQVTDASCGGSDAAPRPRASRLYIPDAEFAVTRDPVADIHTDSCYVRKRPAPILKKPKVAPITREFYSSNGYDLGNYYTENYDLDEIENCDVEKDTRKDKLDRISFMKSSFNFCDSLNSEKSFTTDRKMIYNEGISDKVANQYPLMPMAIPAPLKKDSEKVSLEVSRARSVYADEERLPASIPFSHRSDSRYHQHCAERESRVYYGVEEPQLVGGSPGLALRPRPAARCRTPPSKLPKRVLTSERDIDSYIENISPKIPVPSLSSKRKLLRP